VPAWHEAKNQRLNHIMFVTPAFAQAAGAAAPGGAAAMANLFIPMIAIFGIFWFFIIRPQQAQVKAQRARIDAVKKGDGVITAGGIVGKVTKVDADFAEVEIASGVKVKVVKATLSEVNPLGTAKPAND
jgi:preprotein translocase subunit YajC